MPTAKLIHVRHPEKEEELNMSEKITVSLPELMFIGATRGMIGFGAGMLISNLISRNKRKIVGAPLFAIGLLTTIPIAARIFHNDNPSERDRT